MSLCCCTHLHAVCWVCDLAGRPGVSGGCRAGGPLYVDSATPRTHLLKMPHRRAASNNPARGHSCCSGSTSGHTPPVTLDSGVVTNHGAFQMSANIGRPSASLGDHSHGPKNRPPRPFCGKKIGHQCCFPVYNRPPMLFHSGKVIPKTNDSKFKH